MPRTSLRLGVQASVFFFGGWRMSCFCLFLSPEIQHGQWPGGRRRSAILSVWLLGKSILCFLARVGLTSRRSALPQRVTWEAAVVVGRTWRPPQQPAKPSLGFHRGVRGSGAFEPTFLWDGLAILPMSAVAAIVLVLMLNLHDNALVRMLSSEREKTSAEIGRGG